MVLSVNVLAKPVASVFLSFFAPPPKTYIWHCSQPWPSIPHLSRLWICLQDQLQAISDWKTMSWIPHYYQHSYIQTLPTFIPQTHKVQAQCQLNPSSATQSRKLLWKYNTAPNKIFIFVEYRPSLWDLNKKLEVLSTVWETILQNFVYKNLLCETFLWVFNPSAVWVVIALAQPVADYISD